MHQNQSIQTHADYADALFNLAKEENLAWDKNRLIQLIRKYKLDDVERIYDACLRFGIVNILNNI